jgi:hypothetical protein
MRIPCLAPCLILLLNLGAPSIADDLKPPTVKNGQSVTKRPTTVSKAVQPVSKNAITVVSNRRPSTTPLQGGVQKNRKSKGGATATVTTTPSPYSISQPYNPNNPPPIDNKIHPVSSNAR